MRSLAAALLVAFTNSPQTHEPRFEPRHKQLDRAFFVDSIKRLVETHEVAVLPRETATPLYDAPTRRLYVGTRDSIVRCFVHGKLAWSTVTPGPILAAPIIEKDDLYVPTAHGELLSLNRYTGEKRW